ncbi:MAG TPA: YtxH domain-containing protein [Gemmatimonadaceae bacterium]|nr:YtxH domain-containing protein [Gemmatimonadaceae bacterium]
MHTPASDDTATDSATKTRPSGSPYKRVPRVPDRKSASMLGLGMVIGVAIGAGIALMMAPGSGEELREKIRDRVSGMRGGDDAWGKLKRELRRAKKLRRTSEVEKRRALEEKMLEKERAEKDARTVTLGK